jgi:hypothetical protein
MIETLQLFPMLDRQLIELLTSLNEEEWHKPTRARLWCVKDIATHLLDGNLRTLSMSRDHYFGESPGTLAGYGDLVKYLDRLNADWVAATKRLSPKVLVALLETTGREYHAHLETLDLFAPAIFSVDWAGEKKSLNWFHIAREYTEKWHHQQQIREAVNKPGIMDRKTYFPVLQTFMQALPYAFKNTPAPTGTTIKITVEGEAGGDWFLEMTHSKWVLKPTAQAYETQIRMDQDTAWKLLTKGLSRADAELLVQFSGNQIFVKPVLSMVAVMA